MRSSKTISSSYNFSGIIKLLAVSLLLATRGILADHNRPTAVEQAALDDLGDQLNLCENYSRAFGACEVLNMVKAELYLEPSNLKVDCAQKPMLFAKMNAKQQAACNTLLADHGDAYLELRTKIDGDEHVFSRMEL